LRYAAVSDMGRVRDKNEDAFHADGRVFIVADGMGGHRAGEVASTGAIREFLRFERENRDLDPLERVRRGVLAANRALYDMAREDPSLEGMGTTFTVALAEEGLHLGHVGDSRAYLWRKEKLRPLTRDHSLVERMVREGRISRLEARLHPQRNIILRALGIAEELEVDLRSLSVVPGDRMLLCSDGLTGLVEDDELEAVIGEEEDLEERCRRLVEMANRRGGADNITAVLVDFEEYWTSGRFVARSARRSRPGWLFRARSRGGGAAGDVLEEDKAAHTRA